MFTDKLPLKPGLYNHRYVMRGIMKEQVLFVGYTNASCSLWQGTKPNEYANYTLKCCKPDEYLHADRLTPKEWRGYWELIEERN